MPELEPVEIIQQRLKKAAAKADIGDHCVSISVRVIDRQPLGRRNELVNELYPAAGGRLTTRPTTLIRLTAEIERTAWDCLKRWRGADRQTTRQLSTKIRSELEMPSAEYFVVTGPDDGWRWVRIYWSRWYMAVDRVAGRCIALDVGASD